MANTGPWPGAVLLDPQKAFFRTLGGREMDIDYAASAGGKAELRAAVKRAKAAGFAGDMQGEGMLLGGLLVVAAGGRAVLARAEERWGDKADPAAVLAAAGEAAGEGARAGL